MGLFSRSRDIVSAKANKALDKAERPDEMLDLSYEKMLEQITQVRRALVDIAAARKRIELQAQQLQHSADHLTDQARTAVGAGREDLAREALTRKAAAIAQIQDIEPQHHQLMEEEDKLTRTLQALQARVNQFRTQKETLKAQYTAAKASTAVNENLAGLTKSIGDSGAALQRAQDKIAGLQARSGALDELLESGALEELGTGGDDIDRELRQLGAASSVDQELAALKAGLPASGALAPPPAEALPAGEEAPVDALAEAETEEGTEPGRPA
jgi:phage shock protein A